MGYLGNADTAYTGGSGQMAVMSELLQLNCNVAIPHIDVGTDVFAHRDDREDVARIQVKTARGRGYKKKNGYTAHFAVPLAQLKRTDEPPLFYALAVRLETWKCFVVISRTDLQDLWNNGCGVENEKSKALQLYIQFNVKQNANNETALHATCGDFDLTGYLNAWASLPPLRPLRDI